MSLSETTILSSMHCSKCSADVVWPADLTNEAKQQIAGQVRADRFLGTKWIISEFDMGVEEAKTLALHVTRHKGECHRCQKPLEGGAALCGNCRSVNLDW